MNDVLKSLGLAGTNSGVYAGRWIESPGGDDLVSTNPATGEPIATVRQASEADYEAVMAASQEAFGRWRMLPAPHRGEHVRRLGNALRERKSELGRLVSLEMGKITTEGEGEVQEMIDIADFSVGLSRQLYGLTIQSERPQHRMMEQWHPLGPVGVITAFNFPVAVWAWNSCIAAACGDTVVWKPSSSTPLTAIAVSKIAHEVMAGTGFEAVFSLVIGQGRTIGQRMLDDRRFPLISATGSCTMGQKVAEACAKRFGRSILELGGNNAVIVMDDADLDLALRGVVFGAVGTAGQRCTSTRRLFLHRDIAAEFTERMVKAYGSVTIGDPLDPATLMGPLVTEAAVKDYQDAIATIGEQGGEIIYGGKRLDRAGNFVEPTIVRARHDLPIIQHETFAPILYLIEFSDLDEVLHWHNDVPQGLSSAMFTRNLLAAETFLSPRGSDCGIANVNLGTSGAEIGGAFGGEKDTGGGRESGSDAWKAYMRRQTNTVNWGAELPLAQGVRFDV
jgi:aldehyde dehydrogenase (NAD+)